MVNNTASLPLVSIIVPVFNGEEYLRQSLDSIIAQVYPRTEITVIDDASTDRTPAIAASYGHVLQYHRQEHNRGSYENVNDHIATARGDYVAIYHADDIYEPCIVERQVEALESNPEAGAAFCKDIFIDPDGREVGRLQLPPTIRGSRPLSYPLILNTLLMHKNRFLRCPSCMVRVSAYRDVGPYDQEHFRNTADLEMYLRIARKYPIIVLDEYLFRYRRGHTAMSSRYRHLRQQPENFFKIMDLYLEEGGRALATPRALAAYEAHRAEDFLMLAINNYIISQCEPAREMLQCAHARRIFASPRVQRWRLLLLWVAMQVLLRLPRIPALATMFYRRWHSRVDQAKRGRPMHFLRAQN